MMMKGLMFQQQQQQQDQENMSNLTSASGEAASVSSGNRNEQHFAHPPPAQTQPPLKKKRNLPGNPDPDAEVIALSPKTLMATNRFVCEICNKGFQRDQNLQLHRRGHNLPWKLKQRTNKDIIIKKVYVCPEASCVHHDPSRALGDLTGIKKHFSRKHGEKKWKCDKCSKKYAVQSDWKAHSKTCGTREYRCDCGTLFSRRDSFITHRAFCDALAEESARAINTGLPTNNNNNNNQLLISPNLQIPITQFHAQGLNSFSSLKKEQQSLISNADDDSNRNPLRPAPELPPWLACPPGLMGPNPGPGPPNQHHSIFSSSPNPNPSLGTTLSSSTLSSPHMSATALLQKAAQMGATVSNNDNNKTTPLQHQAHVSEHSGYNKSNNTNTTMFGLNLPSRDQQLTATSASSGPYLLHDMMMNSGFDAAAATSFEDAFVNGVLGTSSNGKKEAIIQNGEGLTRDFLGLRPLSQSDILSMAAGLGACLNTPSPNHEQYNHRHLHHHQSHKPWQG